MDETIQHKSIEESLTRIPFFNSLSSQALSAISAKLKSVRFQDGQVVFAENSPADGMYLIESGQVKVSVNTGPGLLQQEKVINYLGPGNFFGEMALILDQPRSATVTVTIDADLWKLSKSDMDTLLVENPEIGLQLSRELSRRLSDAMTEVEKRSGYSLMAVFGEQPWRLAESIHQITGQRVVLFDATGQQLIQQVDPERLNGKFVILEADESLSNESLAETLGILVDGYDWVLIALPPQASELNVKMLRLTKATVLLNLSEAPWMATATKGPIFQCDINNEIEVGRTARKITQRVIGLALSSGGARGIAHIGVLKALQAANIPIDMIAGTSAGSLFGGLYACGKSLDEIADFARNLPRLIELKSGLWDPKFRLPWNGLIRGDATLRYLAKQFNDVTFAETDIPFHVVAADVLSGEEIIFDEGPVAEAVRASIGIIGIFAPYPHEGRYLIDGGAVNPVPATVLAERGANIIIASSVIPSIEEERARGQAAAKQHKDLNFLGVLSSMMAIMEREIVKTRMHPVDVLIRPKVEIYTAMDYDKANHFVQLGQEAAEQQLPLIENFLGH